jgi:quinolinate synthase
MRMITLPKVYNSLLDLAPQLEVDAEVSRAAVKSIHAMLDISEKLGL